MGYKVLFDIKASNRNAFINMMMRTLLLGFVVLFNLQSLVAQDLGYNQLRNGFNNPPQNAKPLVWWDWANGSVTKEGIKADLVDMKRVGVGGVQFFDLELYMPKGPVRYGSDEWYDHVEYSIRIADSLGLEFHVMNCPGWSASGGPWITPELSMKRIVWSDTTIDGGYFNDVQLPLPEIVKGYYEEIAVIAIPANQTLLADWKDKIAFSNPPKNRDTNPDTASSAIQLDQVLDISSGLSDNGHLSCHLPAGKWSIIRFGYTTTGRSNHPAQPEGKGLECDKLDEEAVKFQFENALGRIISDSEEHLGSTFKGILFDSFEGGYQNWTGDLPAEFKRINGYDLMPYLPALTGRVIESKEVTESVLFDFRNTIDELLVENYNKTMQDLAHENDLIVYSESQGGPLNPFLTNQYVDVPMNEFWLRNYIARIPKMKQTAASAHLYNKPIVGAESFTAIPDYGKWQSTPMTLKRAGDCAFTAGINRFIFHTYVHQPYSHLKPGFTMGRYGTHFGRQSVWWQYANGWIDYITRSQFLLQQGRTVTDIGVLIGNDLKYTVPSGDIKPPSGYDLTMLYGKHLDQAKVVDGELWLSEMARCKVLILNKRDNYISLNTLRNLHRLILDGAIVAGEPPVGPPGYIELKDSLAKYEELVNLIWGDLKPKTWKPMGAGRVLRSTNLQWVIDHMDLTPDLEFAPNHDSDSLRYIHKTAGDVDIYLISNLTNQKVSTLVKLRSSGRKPEFWDAMSGKVLEVPEYKAGERTEIPISLAPGEARFIIFSEKLPSRWITKLEPNVLKSANDKYLIQGEKPFSVHYSDKTRKRVKIKQCPEPIDLSENWSVSFIDGRGAPQKPVMFEKLISWTERPEDGIKFYSGVAEYVKVFTLPQDYPGKHKRCILELGEIRDIAQVTVNGHKPQFVWNHPAELDITDMLVAGENTLIIGIANRWINRLIGDERTFTESPRYRQGNSNFTNGVIEEFPKWMGDQERAAQQNPRFTFTTWKHYTPDSELQKSGLIGPVRLVVYNEFNSAIQ